MPSSSSFVKDTASPLKKASAFSSGKSSKNELVEGKALPSNQDAEQGLLAACIVDTSGEVLGRCMEQSIGPDHFYHHSHQLIFEALMDLHQDNQEADEILLAEKLSTNGHLDTVGGQEALIQLTSRIDTTAHAPYWLDIVKQKALLRKCIYVAFEIIDGANQLQGSVDDFLAGMEQSVCESGDEQNVRTSIPFREPITHAMEQIQRMLSREEMDGLLTGYNDLDTLTNGF